jgi:hypothetical protein
VAPDVIFRMLSSALIGVAVMRLSDRLAPGEDADALARDVLDVTLAGLRSTPSLRSRSARCDVAAAAEPLQDAHVS